MRATGAGSRAPAVDGSREDRYLVAARPYSLRLKGCPTTQGSEVNCRFNEIKKTNIYIYICSVCMYVCTYVRRYVCMHACMYVRMYACVHVSMYVCMYVCMYAHIYIYTYTHV